MKKTLPDTLIPHPNFSEKGNLFVKSLSEKSSSTDTRDMYTCEGETYYVKAQTAMYSLFENMMTTIYHAILGSQSPKSSLLIDANHPSSVFFGSQFAPDYTSLEQKTKEFHPVHGALHLKQFEKVTLTSLLLQEADIYGNGNIGSIAFGTDPSQRLAFRIDFGQAFFAESSNILFNANSFSQIVQALSTDLRLFPHMATYEGIILALEEIAGVDQAVLQQIFTEHLALIEQSIAQLRLSETAVAQEIAELSEQSNIEIDNLNEKLQILSAQLNTAFFDDESYPEATTEELSLLDQYNELYNLYLEKIDQLRNKTKEIMQEKLGRPYYQAPRQQEIFEDWQKRKDVFFEQLNNLPVLITALKQEPVELSDKELCAIAEHQDLLEKILPTFELIQTYLTPLQKDYAQTQSKLFILALLEKRPEAEKAFEDHLAQLESVFSHDQHLLKDLAARLPHQEGYPALQEETLASITLQSKIVEYNQHQQEIIQEARRAIHIKKISLASTGSNLSGFFQAHNKLPLDQQITL